MKVAKKQYEFIQPLSRGEFADIYLCHEQIQGQTIRNVVVKVLKTNWLENQEAVRYLREEVALLQVLRHRNIPQIYEITAIRGKIAVVMEWIGGMDLRRLIRVMREMKQRIPLKVSLEIIAGIAETLDAAYNQAPTPGRGPLRVLHGNIKPSNIVLNKTAQISILDFGLSRTEWAGRESSTREMQFDTVDYVAPEKLFFEPQSSASDIYSLSITLFEMLAGKSFGKSPPSEEKHAAKIEKYCQHLLRPIPLRIEVKDKLYELLVSGMSYHSEKRPLAHEFAEEARKIARSITGVSAEQWAQKAVGYFQKSHPAPNVTGGLQGEILGEDTQIYEQNCLDEFEPDDVDTAIMRRGVVADLVEASLDIPPEEITNHIPFNDPLVQTGEALSFEGGNLAFEGADFDELDSKPITNSFGDAPSMPLPPLQGERQPVGGMSRTMVPGSYNTSIYGQKEKLEVTNQSISRESISDMIPAMQISPKAMTAFQEPEKSTKPNQMALLLIGGAVLILIVIVGALWYFSQNNSNEVVSSTMSKSQDNQTSKAVASDWAGMKVISYFPEPRKLKVDCETGSS